jgi:DNA-binding FadR family transcriptional regulator
MSRRAAPTVVRRSEKKSEVLARQILRDVLARRLQPGTMLPSEASMVQDYEVGRTTLREALRILEVQGILGIRPGPGGGPIVSEAGSRSYARTSSLFFQAGGVRLLDVMEARMVLEPVMARLAAEQRNGTTDPALREAVEQLAAGERLSAARFAAATRAFHDAVAALAGQAVLALFCRALDDVVSERTSRFAYPAHKRDVAAARLVTVGKAILRGNAAAAERLMREHMDEHNRCTAEARGGGVKSVVAWG